jgi:hypothetical protein
MKITEALRLIIDGDTKQKSFDVVSLYSRKFISNNKLFSYKDFEYDDIISIAITKLYLKKDLYIETKAQPITWYTKILYNEAVQYHKDKIINRKFDYIDIEFDNGKDEIQYQFEDVIVNDYQLESEDVRLYIKANEPMLYYYLYTIPYDKTINDKITYNDLVIKFDLKNIQTAKNRIRLAKQKTIFHFTGDSDYTKEKERKRIKRNNKLKQI